MSFFSSSSDVPTSAPIILVLFLISLRTFPFPSLASLNIDTDKDALISLKSQLNLEPLNPLSSWHQNSPYPCNWTGVLCSRSRHRVIGLNLSSLGLVGSISPHIANLSFLHTLQLQSNQLSGVVPPEIFNLPRLRALNLSYNMLEGSVPSNLSKFSELTAMDLMGNKISGKIPKELSFLTKLQVLKLGRNMLSGPIPPQLANLSSLVNLNLGTNTLHGVIPSDLSLLRELQYLDLTINNLTGMIPPSIYNMSSLVSLAVASNRLWGRLPYNVGHTLPNLLVFNFCFNMFTGRIPGSLHNLTNIQIIRMAHNQLEGTVPPGLGNLPFLKMYNIGYNRINNSGDNGLEFISSLTNSTNLAFLAFDGNHLRGKIPESIGNLSKSLSVLFMGKNQIHGQIPASIGQLSGLTLLNISDNGVTGAIPESIGQLKSLNVLSLGRNQLYGGIPNSLGNLQKLTQIDLSGNQLVAEIPRTFGSLQNLLSMDLSSNRLSGTIPKEILNIPSLSTILNLSNNFLSGSLPLEISVLESLVAIDFSNNSLSGVIPETIKNCKSLQNLCISRNGFSGTIPAALGEMQTLEILDLSHNCFSGSVPSDLQNLKALYSLNLSFNHLEGSVPCEGIFKSPGVQLKGNPKLSLHFPCGAGRTRFVRVSIIIVVVVLATTALVFATGALFYVWKGKRKIHDHDSGQVLKEQFPLVKYDELRRATGNFNSENLIGSGGFGSVYKGQLNGDGADVAIKVIDVTVTGSHKSFIAECMALRNVRHRNLVKLITSCVSVDVKNTDFFALIYEYLGNGSLADWLTGNKKKGNGVGLNLLERLNVAIDVASALDYLHHDGEVPVVHCDLKPSNILLDEDMIAKIGDFGLARILMERFVDQPIVSSTDLLKGSIGYMPPEYGLGAKPSIAGDVYSFGVTLLELITGKCPTDQSFMGGKTLVGWVQSAFPENIPQVLDPQLLNLLDDMTEGVDYELTPVSSESDSEINCLNTIVGVALSCTVSYPDGRLSIRQAVSKLKESKNILLRHVPVNKYCK